MSKFLAVLGGHKEEVVEEAPTEEPASLDPADKFKKVLVDTIVRWASESFIEKAVLIREMFRWVMAMIYTLSVLYLYLRITRFTWREGRNLLYDISSMVCIMRLYFEQFFGLPFSWHHFWPLVCCCASTTALGRWWQLWRRHTWSAATLKKMWRRCGCVWARCAPCCPCRCLKRRRLSCVNCSGGWCLSYCDREGNGSRRSSCRCSDRCGGSGSIIVTWK